jgi:CubicO group peptidase (beta-lactamase class C family)
MKILRASSQLLSLLLIFGTFILSKPVAAQQPSKKTIKGYGTAVASLANERGKYLQHWLVAGPFQYNVGTEPATEVQVRTRFEAEKTAIRLDKNKSFEPAMEGTVTRPWVIADAVNDVVNLDQLFGNKDYVAAYAMCEIVADAAQPALFTFGSDDAIRVWLNGTLVHDNWALRGHTKDDDVVPVQLIKGSNQLLVKVQDMQYGWEFSARILGPADIQKQYVMASGDGDFEKYEIYRKAGASVDGKNDIGLTALMAARLNGREDMVKELLAKGAKDEPMPAPELLVSGVYNNLQSKKAPGIAILISQNGQVIYRNAFGYADIENNVKMSSDMRFKIGSITKQFTGVAILKLQEEGKLSVEDKLSKYIPDFPRGNEVTIHHLLTHTSGIHSYTNSPDFLAKVLKPISEDDLVTALKKEPYDFNPGESFLYNNTAFVLLGYIIHKASGVEYGDYLKKTFFEPLGMTNTGYSASGLKIDNLATGYDRLGAGYVPSPVWDLSWAGGAGALYSTIDDLQKWNEALFNGKILQEKSLKAGFTSVVLNNGQLPPQGEYGYGWFINDFRGLRRIAHGGGLAGYISELTRYPSENMTVVMLTNMSPPEQNMDPNILSKFYLWTKLAPQTSRLPGGSEVDISQYPGRYDFGNGMVMVISADGNRLFGQLTGQQKFEIFPQGNGEYYWKVVDARIKFVRDESGKVTHGEFQQNGTKLKVLKLPEHKIVTVDIALYKLYAGKYNLGNNMVLDITSENDHIYVQATNQPRFEMFPVSDQEFVLQEANSRLTFYPADGGTVKKLALKMGDRSMEGERIE